MKNTYYIELALKAAKEAEVLGQEVPIGAVIVMQNKILSISGNRTLRDHDPTGHAEMVVLREAANILKTPYLDQCDLYVTLEPCAMCAQAMAFARIKTLYFGAYDPKGGGVDHGARIFQQPTCHHKPEVFGGFMEEDCGKVLKAFFETRRD